MKSNWSIFIILFLVGFAVFSNGLKGDFVHDDHLVLSHSFFGQPAKILNFFNQPYFEDFYQAGLYRPLTQISFGLNFLFGSNPFGFHLVNILLHIFNSFLIFILIRKMAQIGLIGPIGQIGPIATSLLFLVLPIHVEAVTSIVGRAELLSFLFSILTLFLWLDSKYFYSAVTLILALLSKETAIAVPVIILFLTKRIRPIGRIRLIGIIGPIAFYFILRILVLGQYAFRAKTEFVFNPLAYTSFFERFFTALKVLVLYLVKSFVPYRLSADYSYDQIPVVTNLFSSPLVLVGLITLGLIVWLIRPIGPTPLLKVAGRVNPTIRIGLIFFLFPYLVISNLILPIGTIMADRLMYFPSLGIVLILGLAFERLFKFSKRVGFISLLILLFAYGFIAISQNRIWLNREALITDIFKKSRNSVAAKTEYGILILNKDKELAKKLSLEVYEKYPDYIQNLNLRGAIEVQEGDFIEAEKFLERALELRLKHQNTLQNLSRVYFTLGKYQKTEEILEVLVSNYGGKGNVIFYALVQAKDNRLADSRRTLESFFGPEIKDESAQKILRGELEELENFYIFHKQ